VGTENTASVLVAEFDHEDYDGSPETRIEGIGKSLQVDPEEAAAAMAAASPDMSIDEAREFYGLPPIAGGVPQQ
jgi:hypothetical protein